MQPQPSVGVGPLPPSPPRTGNLAQLLSIVAVILAVVALVVSFAIPGPQGPAGTAGTNGTDGANGARGPQGPQGLPGNGTLMASNSTGATFTVIGSSCTNAGLSLTITVPRSGNITVQGSTRMRIDHTSGTEDRWFVKIGATATDCNSDAWSWLDSIESAAPTQAQVWVSAYTQNVFPVTAGTSTFYFNGYMVTGADTGDVFVYANLIAFFIPG